jgi:hypothetical protein
MSDAWEFKHTDCDGKVVSVTFNGDTWFDALNVFEQFLRGCGFSVPEGEIKALRNDFVTYRIYPSKPDGEGWVSNRGNVTRSCPINHNIWQIVEAVYRNGDTEKEQVVDIDQSKWQESNQRPDDIVWFRFVN